LKRQRKQKNIYHLVGWLLYGVQRHFQQYFSYIVAVSFIGGENHWLIGVLNYISGRLR
jgi:hypothetical protein